MGDLDVVVAGAHGQIARLLVRRLCDRGARVRGLIRNAQHAADVRGDGAEPIECDLEQASPEEIAAHLQGAGAVVFAAGAGPGSGAPRKNSLDRDGAIKLLDAAKLAGVERYVMISAVGAESPPAGDDVFSVYLRAKAEADSAVRAGDRAWTILRPGRLTDEPGTGRVQLVADPLRGEVPRADVAAVVEAILEEPRSAGLTLYLRSGDDAPDAALRAAAGHVNRGS
jgi:uncharacterized protein YbjT (DUF2867 family)